MQKAHHKKALHIRGANFPAFTGMIISGNTKVILKNHAQRLNLYSVDLSIEAAYPPHPPLQH